MMIYRINPKNGDKISQLAYGCMRFPRDEAEAGREVAFAIENGVNYLDTAYISPGSEATTGRILKKYGLRDQVNIATKLPHYLVRKPSDFDKMFNTSLERLQTNRIDYYLQHMFTKPEEWTRMKELGAVEWTERQKREGRIRNIGFSFHGGAQSFVDILEAYDWDFCMIQYNYLDVNAQAGQSGLARARALGIPVMIMEPLRGGKLANALPPKARELWDSAQPKRSYAEWAFRWLWNQEGILTVLSGMNSMDMVKENIRVASEAGIGAMTEAELALFDAVRDIIAEKYNVPCTGCNYCMPCPSGVDIPLCFMFYNDLAYGKRLPTMMNYAMRAGEKNASRCVRCGKCEAHCPQSILIREKLAETVSALEGFPYGAARAVMKRFAGF